MSEYGALPGNEEESTEFRKQKRCNDVLFAIAYYVHLGVILTVLLEHNPAEGDSKQHWNAKGVLKFVGIISAVAVVLSTLALGFMSAFAGLLVEIALITSLLVAAGVGGYGVYVTKWWMAGAGGVAFLAGFIFTCCIWKRIGFAAANLRTALTAIRTNLGLALMAYVWEAVAFAWTILWMDSAGAAMDGMGWGMIFLYLISFFWTQQVINNLQHTIVASVIGTWWYNPADANSFWDDGLNRAICHSTTLSFGSICFGSLLASIVQALKWLHRLSKDNDKCSCVSAMIDCCLSCLQEMIEYFNKWAYTFVGIHGDSYIQGGREAVSLFKKRGWVALIADGLAEAVMIFIKLAIAAICGIAGWYLVSYDDDIFEGIGISRDKDDMVGFGAGLLIGYLLAGIMMELVSSAINAVIVCFAEAPAEFEKNYPELCAEMLEAWKDAYPDECSDDFAAIED